jgi:hypothetical protein
MSRTDLSRPWKNTVAGVKPSFHRGWVMATFEYRQAQELNEAFARNGVRYLFLGKSAAILLGFPDTTQVVDLFPQKSPENGNAIVQALRELGYQLTDTQIQEITRGKDLFHLRNGPFDMNLVFAPDGIETFERAWSRHLEVEGFPLCNLDDIIASKQAANRPKDRESLPRLIAFRDYWQQHRDKK